MSGSNSLEERIAKAIAAAHTVCAEKGDQSPECAVAWDIVEELQAEASHQRSEHHNTPFEQYCEDNPGAIEARIYDD